MMSYNDSPLGPQPGGQQEPIDLPVEDDEESDGIPSGPEEGSLQAGQLELLGMAPVRYGRRVVAFASGKGGVGKSLLCANLGIFLAQLGKRVVMVDANLGCANLHMLLGVDHSSRTLADFLERRISRLDDAVTDTSVLGLGLISGEQDPAGVANAKPAQKARLLDQLRQLSADYVLLDLAPGTGLGVVDLLLSADIGVIVAIPEPGSVEASYRLIKSVFLRRLRGVPQSERLVAHARREGGIPAPLDLCELAEAFDAALSARLREELQAFVPRLIVNQTRTRDDVDLGPAMRSAARRRLGITFDFLGSLEYDEAARVAVRRCRPVAIEYPDAKITKGLERIARRILAFEGSDSLRHTVATPPKRWDQLTYFEILEVDPGASDEEIRRAHRRAREVYAHDSMVVRGLFAREELDALARRIEEAYDTLIAPDRRRRYELEIFPGGRPASRSQTPQNLPVQVVLETPSTPAQPELPVPDVGPDTVFTGELLRRIRESKRIELIDISQKTKIGVTHLRNIEEERFRELPALVYVRGFLKEYARYLKLDPQQVARTYLERYHAALGTKNE